MPAPLVPEDDLYRRLEVGSDASPEAIDLAWRALLKRHHPDIAGDGADALDRAKRINVAHDWLSDPDLRARYDADRAGIPASVAAAAASARGRGGRMSDAPWRRRPAPVGAARHRRPTPVRRTNLFSGTPEERLARFLARVERLTPDELDRLAAAEPPPIAFLATVQRFVPPEGRASFAAAESALVARVPHDRWAETGLREGLLGVAAELVLTPFLDDMLAEPFRGRARDRLLRAWEASVDQPRWGPNGATVGRLRDRLAALTPSQVAAWVRGSQGVNAGERPWPESLDRDEDEALRISAELAARDVAAAVPVDGLAPATSTRVRRLAARLGFATALRHAFAAGSWAVLVAPLDAATGGAARPSGPDAPGAESPAVRRAR